MSPDSGTVLDVAYNLLKMDVSTGILNLFDLPDLPDRGRSVYASSIHVMSVGLRLVPTDRLTLSLRYSFTKDTAGGWDGLARDGSNLFSGLAYDVSITASAPVGAPPGRPAVERRLAVLRIRREVLGHSRVPRPKSASPAFR